MNLKNKTALITGASRGIGKAIALKMAACGANIAFIYAGDASLATETEQELAGVGVHAKAYCCDVADFDATAQTVSTILADFNNIDILVNNAGIVRDGLILSMKEQDFDDVIRINLKGAFNMTKHLYQHFMRKRSGRIINITSVVGLNGNAGQANYAAAKAGLVGLTKSTARELAARSVTCNAIAPGFIETDMTRALSEKNRQNALVAIPARRIGTVEEVAGLATFLASDSAAYITGEVIRVDGGLGM